MVLPDDGIIAFRNIIGGCTLFACLYVVALAVKALEPDFVDILSASSVVFIAMLLLINRFARSTAENAVYHSHASKAGIIALIVAVFAFFIQMSSPVAPVSLSVLTSPIHRHLAEIPMASNNVDECYNNLCKGHWDKQDCPQEGLHSSTAMCQLEIWDWEPEVLQKCHIKHFSITELQSIYAGKKVAFLGDSMIRNVFHSLSHMLDSTYVEDSSPSQKHQNQKFVSSTSDTTFEFYWSPFLKDITSTLTSFKQKQYSIIVFGSAAWDALHVRNVSDYQMQLAALAESKVVSNLDAFTIFLQPTTIVDGRLTSKEKQQYMTESIIAQYRNAYSHSLLKTEVSLTLDPTHVTILQPTSSADGVHYTSSVYQVLSQLVSNGYYLKFPTLLRQASVDSQLLVQPNVKAPVKAKGPKKTGAMGNLFDGMLVLIFSAIMMFTFDSFFGVGVFSLALFGGSVDWESAYIPLMVKIGIMAVPLRVEASVTASESGNDDGSSVPLLHGTNLA
jgi:hypothetical protein